MISTVQLVDVHSQMQKSFVRFVPFLTVVVTRYRRTVEMEQVGVLPAHAFGRI